MTNSTLEATPVKSWLDALHESTNELAQVAFGWDGIRVLDDGDVELDELQSAFAAIVGDATALQIGVGAMQDGCQRLSKALLVMTPDEPDLPSEDVADAMCEISNILAGGVKKRIAGTWGEMKIGLPLFVAGPVRLSSSQRMVVSPCMIGDVQADLAIIYPRE